jgi:hypothetical protein
VKPLARALLLALAACTAHVAPPLPSGERTALQFALIGDTPYSAAEAAALDSMIEEINREDLAFVIHVGDITGGQGPCTDEWLEARKRQFEKFRHPFVIVPGDNEWVDCHRTGFDPMERLGKFRELFEPGDTSLANRSLRLERQSGRYAEYREHLRWIAADVLFVGVNVQGSNNNLGRTPGTGRAWPRCSRGWRTASVWPKGAASPECSSSRRAIPTSRERCGARDRTGSPISAAPCAI